MFSTTAFFHKLPSKEGSKKKICDTEIKRDPSDRGFSRLNSLEDYSYEDFKMTSEKVDSNLPPSPSSKESKWFSDYPQQSHFVKNGGKFQNTYLPPYAYTHQNQMFNNSQIWSYGMDGMPSYQVPYNLTKGQFEVWPMQPVNHMMHQYYPHQLQFTNHQVGVQPHQGLQDQDQEESSISGIVNCVLEAGVSVLTSAMTSFSSFSLSMTSLPASGSKRPALNPNAKAFTPLNPNAKEFRPASESSPKPSSVPETKEESSVTPPNGKLYEDQSNMITPENKPELKTVAYRKCTPWVPKHSQVDVHVQHGDQGEHVPLPSDISDFEVSDSSDDEDDENDDDITDDNQSRPRLLSICSSENDFIQFEDSSPASRCSKSPPKIPENPSTFLKNFLAGHEDEEDDDESSDDEDFDVDDWDRTIDAIFIDDENQLQELGLHCQWMTEHLPSKSVDVVDNKVVQDDPLEYPGAVDRKEILNKIKAANELWFKNGDDQVDKIVKNSSNKKVDFHDPLVSSVIEFEPLENSDSEQSQELSFAQREADRARNERLLAPIFKSEHRDKMRSYIENCFNTTAS